MLIPPYMEKNLVLAASLHFQKHGRCEIYTFFPKWMISGRCEIIFGRCEISVFAAAKMVNAVKIRNLLLHTDILATVRLCGCF